MDEDKNVGINAERLSEHTCVQCGTVMDVSEVESFTQIACPACGHADTVPARFGSFLLLHLIGAGGMGGVYYAKDETLGRHVAIKVMLKSLGQDAAFVESFKREAQAVAKLNHPNIAQVYAFGQEKDQPYIVMELVTGKRLDKLIEEQHQLDPTLVFRIGLDVAEGLKTADEVGIIHGDIKPENILLDDRMRAKVVDFGLAAFVNQRASEGIWGTPYYISPEKVRRQTLDAQSDIYSLGATLYHALAGRPPFEGSTAVEVVKARLDTSPKELIEVRPDIDRHASDVIARMLKPQSALRYPTYASLISDLRKVLDTLSPAATVRLSRRMIIKKKGAAAAPAPDAGGAPAEHRNEEPPATATAPRIKIHRTGGKPLSESRPSGADAAPQANPHPVSPEQAAKRKKLVRRIVTISLCAAVAAGLITAWVMISSARKARKEGEIAARREKLALYSAQTNAVDLDARVQATYSNVLGAAAAAQRISDTATGAVFAVLGEVFVLPPPPPVVSNPPPATASTNGPTGAPATSNAPPASGGAPVAVAAADGSAPAPAAAVPAEAPAAEPDPPIKIAARQALTEARTISEKATAANELSAASRQACTEALAAPVALKAAGKAQEIDMHLKSIGDLHRDVQTSLENAGKAAQEIDTIKRRTDAAREAQRRRDEAEAREKAEAEARRRAEEAKQAEIQAELTKVQAAAESARELMRQSKYDEAVTTLKGQARDYQTKEGQDAFKILISRFEYLQKTKQILITQLNSDPFKWGWTQDGSQEDVAGADARGIKLRGRTVAWEKVTIPQMMQFLRRYLTGTKPPLSIRDVSNLNMGTAIFIFENGGGEKAKPYLKKAIELRPTFEQEAKLIVPIE